MRQLFSIGSVPRPRPRLWPCSQLRAVAGLVGSGLLTLTLSSCWPINVTRTEYAMHLLGAIHAPTSESNIRVMVGWMQAEGGSCQWNPLNTTQSAPGASNCNDVGVKSYPDADTGLKAEADTLLNGRYDNVVNDFRNSVSCQTLAQDICHSPWGTGCSLLEATVSQACRDDAKFQEWGNKLVAGSH